MEKPYLSLPPGDAEDVPFPFGAEGITEDFRLAGGQRGYGCVDRGRDLQVFFFVEDEQFVGPGCEVFECEIRGIRHRWTMTYW